MDCIETIGKKKLLYKTRVDYQLGTDGQPINDYALNHVLGCSHGCLYPCYAQGTAVKSGNVGSYGEWISPKPVKEALELLERDLRSRNDVKRVHMCFTTDPFPYISEETPEDLAMANGLIGELSMVLAGRLNSHGVPVTFLTKGVLPQIECGHLGYLLSCIDEPLQDNYYGISLASINEGFREEYEPYAAPYAKRLDSLRSLSESGAKTWVSMEPFPALSHAGMSARFGWRYCTAPECLDADIVSEWEGTPYDELSEVLARIPFADRIVFGRWNYNDGMPTDAFNVGEWYSQAAQIVRGFCHAHGIECVVKNGTETIARD